MTAATANPQPTPDQQALDALDRILGSALRRAYDETERAMIGGPAGQLIEQLRAALQTAADEHAALEAIKAEQAAAGAQQQDDGASGD